MTNINLKTLKKASQETGASISFFKQLIGDGQLTRYKINSATYISMTQFENLAKPELKEDIDLTQAIWDAANQ